MTKNKNHRTRTDKYEELKEHTLNGLIEVFKNGEPTAAHFNAATRLLSANNATDRDKEHNPLQDVTDRARRTIGVGLPELDENE